MLRVSFEGAAGRDVVQRIREDVQKRRGQMLLATVRELRFVAPVDTGFFRAHCLPARESAASALASRAAAIPPPKNEKDREPVRRAEGLQQAAMEAGRFTDAPLDRDLWLFNNLDYAVPLVRDGYSQKAPANFFELAIRAGVDRHAR